MPITVINVTGLPANTPDVVYIGRAWQGWKASPLANPHNLGRCRQCGMRHRKGETLPYYEEWLRDQWRTNGPAKAALLAIVAKVKAGEPVTLGCWCKDHPNDSIPCHGDVIRKVVNTLIAKGY